MIYKFIINYIPLKWDVNPSKEFLTHDGIVLISRNGSILSMIEWTKNNFCKC